MKSPMTAVAAAAFSSASSPSSSTTSLPSTLTLFGPAFTRVFRCLWMLEELGVPYEHMPRTFPGSRRAKELHPLGKVPMLIENYQTEDSFVMTESANINQYLADKYGSVPPPILDNNHNDDLNDSVVPPLLVPPAGSRLRARQDQLVFTIMTELDAQGVWIHRKHEALGETFGHFPEVVEHAQRHFDRVTQAICETNLHVHYQQRQEQYDSNNNENPPIYLLGPNLFSAADILFVHTLGWAKAIQWGMETWQQDAVLANYLETCHQRPAYQRAAAIRRNENLVPQKPPVQTATTEDTTSTTAAAAEKPSKL